MFGSKIVSATLLKCHSKAECRAPAYSRALLRVIECVQTGSLNEVQVRLPESQMERLDVRAGVVWVENCDVYA